VQRRACAARVWQLQRWDAAAPLSIDSAARVVLGSGAWVAISAQTSL